MLVCCWFDLGLRLLKVENGTFENRTIAGNSHYLVPFGNRTIAGTALIETALTGDPLYYTTARDDALLTYCGIPGALLSSAVTVLKVS